MKNDSAGIHLLYADDNESYRNLFKETVRHFAIPIQFTEADSEEQLFEILNSANPLPDLIFLDYNLSMKSNRKCLVNIRNDEKFGHIPVIIYGNTALPIQLDNARFFGATYYIQKPFHIEEMKEILEWLILNMPKQHTTYQRENFLLSARNLPKL